MLIVQIPLFCILSMGIVFALFTNLNKLAVTLQAFYGRNLHKAFGDGWIRPPSLLVCKIHLVFLGVFAIAIVFNLVVGTIYL
jgi:hypothetical protein